MTAHQGVRVAATTAGIASSPYEHLRVNYVYGGDKPLEAEAEGKHPGPPPGSPKSSQARAERMARFAEARADGKNLTEAAAAAGVTLPTAREYRRALEQEGGGDA